MNSCAELPDPEEEGSEILRNVGDNSLSNTTPYYKRLYSIVTQLLHDLKRVFSELLRHINPRSFRPMTTQNEIC